MNKTGLGEVSSINLKRVQMMKKQNDAVKRERVQSVNNSMSRRSELTRVSTEQASFMQSPGRKGRKNSKYGGSQKRSSRNKQSHV